VNPREVVESLARDAAGTGVRIATGTRYVGRKGKQVQTSAGPIGCGYVVNAGGLYADKIARDYGFSEKYRILPFKGVYLYSETEQPIRTNIYGVPNLANPFLGVHFTVTTDGKTKIGPTAIPAFWREQYDWRSRFSAREAIEILSREFMLFLRNDFRFRSLAWSELQKYRRTHLLGLASEMVSDLRPPRDWHWGRPGIRAQLFDTRSRALVTDFRVEGDTGSMHVLNAVSPAFTCSIPFAAYVVDRIASEL
jgi:L-2-hydroxyglutarate oxidase LhgO